MSEKESFESYLETTAEEEEESQGRNVTAGSEVEENVAAAAYVVAGCICESYTGILRSHNLSELEEDVSSCLEKLASSLVVVISNGTDGGSSWVTFRVR